MELSKIGVIPTVGSFVVITLMAVLGIAVLKMLDDKFPVPGVHDLVKMV